MKRAEGVRDLGNSRLLFPISVAINAFFQRFTKDWAYQVVATFPTEQSEHRILAGCSHQSRDQISIAVFSG